MRTKIITSAMAAVVGAIVLVGVGLLGYASAQPPGYHTFRTTAVEAASSAHDALHTASLVLAAEAKGKTIPPYVSVVLDECRTSLASGVASFADLQPIDVRTTAMRDQLSPLLSKAVIVLGDASRDPAKATELDPVADQLSDFLDQHA